MLIYSSPQPATFIPVVDLPGRESTDHAERERVAWEIHKACRDTGFFYIANHGIDSGLIAAQFDFARRFFRLPDAEKMALDMRHSPTGAGYEPVGGQTLDSQDADAERGPPDLKESFYCGMELSDDDPLARARMRSFGHNQWPAMLLGFREQMLAYREAMCELGDRVLGCIALSLALPEEYFRSYYDPPATTLRILRYPPHPEAALPNQLGAGAHTDWGGITLLAQDEVGGLEVRNSAGMWIEAPPLANAFLVNLGDLMQRWTNDLYRSTMHRVKNRGPGGRDRHSVAFFYGPCRDALIACLPTCTDAARPAKYPPITSGQHTREMFRRSYGYASTREE